MLKDIWNKLMTRSNQATIKALQLEVSSLCQLSCIYCPRTVAGDSWPNRILDWNIYETRIAPHFNLFETVFLQGWGEPLTNPRFWDMAELAKTRGRKVGFTTNGILLDAEAAERACRLGIDVITFTFAGATPETHQYYRAGADYTELKDTIRLLAETKNRLEVAKPGIGITYTMMRNNMHELPEAVRVAAALGVNQMTCGHLDCIPEKSLEAQVTFLFPSRGDKECLIDAAVEARSSDITFDAEPPFMSGEILVCEPHPMRVTLFIRADGTVVPCHAMALPPEAVKNLYFKGKPQKYEPFILGKLTEQEIPEILRSTACRNLQQVFGARADLNLSVGDKIPGAPAFCARCYKLYGV